MKRRRIIATLVISVLIIIPPFLATLGPNPVLRFELHAKPSEWRLAHSVEAPSFEPMGRIPGRNIFQLGPLSVAVRKSSSLQPDYFE